jgi:hypothetical protein
MKAFPTMYEYNGCRREKLQKKLFLKIKLLLLCVTLNRNGEPEQIIKICSLGFQDPANSPDRTCQTG